MNEKTPFWQEVRSTLMLRGDSWKALVESLPARIDAAEARAMLQSADQLARCNMQGVAFIAGSPVNATPDPDRLLEFLPSEHLTLEAIVLQWLYQFLILERIASNNREVPLAEWHPMFLDMFVKGLHFMVYMAALLCIAEELKLSSIEVPGFTHGFPLQSFAQMEQSVSRRVREATENLHSKTQDYGESFRRHGVAGLIPRLWDKVARYVTLKAEDRTANFESMQDSARDLLGYSAIAWSLVLEVPAANDIKKTEIER